MNKTILKRIVLAAVVLLTGTAITAALAAVIFAVYGDWTPSVRMTLWTAVTGWAAVSVCDAYKSI